MRAKLSLLGLIKFGQKAHVQDLLDNGTIYMNHVSQFAKTEDGGLRGDGHEALISIEDIFDIDISIDGQVVAKADSGKINIHSNFPIGNIYSMYYLPYVDDLSKIKIDIKCKDFGDSCLIVFDVIEFVKRIKKAASKSGERILLSPVEYQSISTYNGKWSLFKKPDSFSYQNEFRFLIKQGKFVGPIVLSIGPIHDIATMLSSENIETLKLEKIKK